MDEFKQQLVLNDRRYLRLSGVSKIDDFDACLINLATNLGLLQVAGEDLHICHLDLQTGEVAIEGKIRSLQYAERSADEIKKRSRGVLSRLLK